MEAVQNRTAHSEAGSNITLSNLRHNKRKGKNILASKPFEQRFADYSNQKKRKDLDD